MIFTRLQWLGGVQSAEFEFAIDNGDGPAC
jgi:hypothetical protein